MRCLQGLFITLVLSFSGSLSAAEVRIPCNPTYGKICKDEVPVFWASELVGSDLATEMLDMFWEEEPDLFPLQPKTLKIAVIDSGFDLDMAYRFQVPPTVKLGQYDIHGEFHKAIEAGKTSQEDFVSQMDEIISKRLPGDAVDPFDGRPLHSHLTDPSGHGTMVSGLIAGIDGAGAARNVELEVYGVLDYDVLGAFGAIPVTVAGREGGWLVAVYEACREGSKIINLSMSPDDLDWEFRFAEIYKPLLDYLYDNGCLLVKAAGNESASSKLAQERRVNHPAMVTVAGVQINGNSSGFSNQGLITGPATDVGVYRPEVLDNVRDEFLCDDDDCLQIGGTSFAAPIVSGIAGLVLEVLQRSDRYNSLSDQEKVDVLVEILYSTNQNEPGEIDAARAVRVAIHWAHSGQWLEEFKEIREFCESDFQCTDRGLKCPEFRDCVRDLRFQVSLCKENRVERLTALGDIYSAADRSNEAIRWYNQALSLSGGLASTELIESVWEGEKLLWEEWEEDKGKLNPDVGRSAGQLSLLWDRNVDVPDMIEQFETILWSEYFRYIATTTETSGSSEVQEELFSLFQDLEAQIGFDEAFDILSDRIEKTKTRDDRSDLFWRNSVAIYLLIPRLEVDDADRALFPYQRFRLMLAIEKLTEFLYDAEEAQTYSYAVDEAQRPWDELMKSPLSESTKMIDHAIEKGSLAALPNSVMGFAFVTGRSHYGPDRIRGLEKLAFRTFSKNSEASRFSGRYIGQIIRENQDDSDHLFDLFQTFLDGMSEDYSEFKVSSLQAFIETALEQGFDRESKDPSVKVVGRLKVALVDQVIRGGAAALSDAASKTAGWFSSGFDGTRKALVYLRVSDRYESKIDYLGLAKVALDALQIIPNWMSRGHEDYIKDKDRRLWLKTKREFNLARVILGSFFVQEEARDSVRRRIYVTDSEMKEIQARARKVLSDDQASKRSKSQRLNEDTKAYLEALFQADPNTVEKIHLIFAPVL